MYKLSTILRNKTNFGLSLHKLYTFKKHSVFLFNLLKYFSERPMLMKTFMRSPKGDLSLEETPLPLLKENEVLMKVEAFSVNRADLDSPIPSHHHKNTPLLGLECAGYIFGEDQNKKVMALVNGGAYAEYVAVRKDHLIEIPQNLDVTQAAAIPEAWVTAYGLCRVARVHRGDHVLIHAAASGIGTALIQIVRLFDAESISIISSDHKLYFCDTLGQGTTHGILRKDTSRTNKILGFTKNHGCSVIFDCVGASDFDHNIGDAAFDCRWICYGFLGGSVLEKLDMMKLMNKRISLHFYNLRSSNDNYRLKLLNDFAFHVMPKFASGELVPVIDTVYEDPETNIRVAQKKMQSDLNMGKLVIKW